ncbi:ribosomal protein S18 acetylase RimI-like enzyme [Spinactinospora alkalitolerans]|uniref:Ribosomal protein S18 acetylase RimI-like enzyme n=1 Tax=Spinactinospora alkalitolerans TaxID=687207 RepID=A0A852U575_9ACTN|nr:GNAT family N-acetyltransferase [Spinactinospora alkalitolerans]NYE49234.1 ribosomal protein S18 acetylase RimI-like enzyme [Spinactinospora alkalitolerans]
MTTVRPARSDDARAMSEIFHAAAAVGWAHFLPGGELAAEPLRPEVYAAALRAPEVTVFAAEHGGRVVGFAVTRESQDGDADRGVAELHMLYVHPDAWGGGAARLLMAQALAHFRSGGYAEATLWTAVDNHRPRAFYERHGWVPDGTRRSKTRFGVTFTELRYRTAP